VRCRSFLLACVLAAAPSVAAAQPAPAAPTPTVPAPAPTAPAPTPPAPTPPAPSVPAPPPPAPFVPAPPPPPTPAPAPTASTKLDGDAREAMRVRCASELPGCDLMALLGDLERSAVLSALARRGRRIDPAPWGKPLGRIEVVNLRVFQDSEGFLQFFNVFHATTRERVVEREVLVRPGERWDQQRIDESRRKLRDRTFSVLAVIVPVESATPGAVDALVVTRDVWSLRFNFNARVQGDKFSYLTFSLSENNFLGLRKLLAAVYEMDLGAVGIGPLYIDKNVLGRRYTLRTRLQALFEREALLGDGRFVGEGSEGVFEFNRPLWSLDSKWGYGVEWSHRYAIDRSFQQTGLRTYDDPATDEVEAVPWKYRQRRFQLTTGVTRGFGDRVKHRLKGGHILDAQRPAVTDDFVGPPGLRDAFARDVLPRSERASSLYVGYEVFTPDYRELRNVAAFDLAEDVRLGPSAEVLVSTALELIGSETNFARAQAAASYVHPVGADGLASVAGSVSTRVDGGELIDNSGSTTVGLVSPTLGWVRLVAEARLATLWNETQNRFLSLGGENGLRGFGINQFDGARRAVAQLEVRTRSRPVLFTKWGLVGFYEAGGAGTALRSLRLHHDVGVGLRVLVPQTSPEVFRFDFALPLDGPSAGSLRFTAGFGAAF
jgi:hypothetical protein